MSGVTSPPERIYLAGLSGAGKSTVAALVARWLGVPALDVDRAVEEAAGATVAELWEGEGEPAFRAVERDAVARLVARDGPAVMALGGGTLEDPESRERLAAWGTGVWLDGPARELAARVAAAPGARPLLAEGDPAAALTRLAALRAARFRALPVRVDTAGRRPEAVAVDVLRALASAEPRALAPGVRLGRGALAAAGRIAGGAERVVVATDDRVWDLHGAAVTRALAAAGAAAEPCPLPAGEVAKGVEGLVAVWRALARAGAERGTPLAVLGGGAAGDVGGLAAATYKRGIPLALLPTTLLAQVDAAIGGKNAIDLDGVKNLVGTFHDPALVLVDPLCLLTLPGREWRAGWAEVVKAGLIGDPALLALCEAEADAIAERRLAVVEEAVRRAIEVKLAVVQSDPREAGPRRVLNLGHTLGHAVEAAADGRLLHGEAVAIGLVAAARLAELRGVAVGGLADRVAAALAGLGLPTAPPAGLALDDVLAHARHDKKRAAGVVHAVLPVEPGRVEVAPLDAAAMAAWARDLLPAAAAR